MRLFIIFIFLIQGIFLSATDLPNTGKSQNDYGYYGDDIIFGDYLLIGQWRLCSDELANFEGNGSVTYTPSLTLPAHYGVSENGQILTINLVEIEQTYTVVNDGNNGCIGVDVKTEDLNFGTFIYDHCNICKSDFGSKTYGSNSNTVTFTVGID